MRASLKKLALTGALLLGTLQARAVPADIIDVESLSFDINTLWTIYNSAKQTNGQITEWPQELQDQAGVVVASLFNTSQTNFDGSDDPHTAFFRVTIIETSSSCSNAEVVQGPVLRLKPVLGPGQRTTANAASFTLPQAVVNGNFCQAFEDDIKAKLENVDPSKIQDAIKLFNEKNFQVCLQQCDASGNPVAGAKKACASLKLFSANNVVNQSIVAMLIYPHNNVVPNPFPNFIWSPAILSADLGKSDVWYTLEVNEEGSEAPFWSVDVAQPNAQFYQWTGSDRALVPGKAYCWKVISHIKIGDVKKPVGANGKGWNIKKCFTVSGDAPERCRYTKEDLDKWLSKNASPEVKKALSGATIKNILQIENDPVICRLLAGQVKFTSIKVVKQ